MAPNGTYEARFSLFPLISSLDIKVWIYLRNSLINNHLNYATKHVRPPPSNKNAASYQVSPIPQAKQNHTLSPVWINIKKCTLTPVWIKKYVFDQFSVERCSHYCGQISSYLDPIKPICLATLRDHLGFQVRWDAKNSCPIIPRHGWPSGEVTAAADVGGMGSQRQGSSRAPVCWQPIWATPAHNFLLSLFCLLSPGFQIS